MWFQERDGKYRYFERYIDKYNKKTRCLDNKGTSILYSQFRLYCYFIYSNHSGIKIYTTITRILFYVPHAFS